MHKYFKRQWFTQSDWFTYNAKYFQTLSGEKWRSFASSLRSMLKLHSRGNEAAGNLTIWPTVLDLCLFGRVISTIAFRSLFSSNRLSKRTELYWSSSQAFFLNHTFTFYAIGLLGKSCMWKRKNKKLQYKIPATSSLYYINSEYFRSCWKL